MPIAELAGLYIEEGASTGVRSDIAFAQSMLETGGFSYPAGGQVLGTDNNFAGMGACDSCATAATGSPTRAPVSGPSSSSSGCTRTRT